MAARSRNKGKAGERELARVLTAAGFPATRGQQHRGGPGSPDVLCPSLPGVHFECKRTECLSLYDAVDQARAGAGARLPIVAHRRNARPWLAILDLGDLLGLLRALAWSDRDG
jgi:Holliday junction resolvase